MDYLLNTYVFNYLPFISEATRKSLSTKAHSAIMYFDWWCKAQSPIKIYQNHPSFLCCELVFFFLCALTFTHAWRKGGRYWYVWLGILIHALNVENLCYWIPDLDNFWQAQGILTFFGARAPLYILLGIYHMFDYVAYVFAMRLHLPWWAEGPAVGLFAVMLDMPYDIMGIKMVWWTWHDTDPNIYDRMYWVPWNSYYFHAAFACSFTWILHGARRVLMLGNEYDWKRFVREFAAAAAAGLGAFWLGTVQFAMLYHPMHDILKVHSELTTLVFLGIYAVIVFVADRNNRNLNARPSMGSRRYWFDELAAAVGIHYLFYMILVLVGEPQNVIAEGLWQPIGLCNATQTVQTPTGKVLTKAKYLCQMKYDEKYFDFHCVPGGRPRIPEGMPADQPLDWYTICGTPFENRAEYIFIIWSICILFGTILYQAAARSGETPMEPVKIYSRRSARMNPAEQYVYDSSPAYAERNVPIVQEETIITTHRTPSRSPTRTSMSPRRRKGLNK